MINQEDYTMIAEYDCTKITGSEERGKILEQKGDQVIHSNHKIITKIIISLSEGKYCNYQCYIMVYMLIYLKCENFQTSLIFNLCSFSPDFGRQRKIHLVQKFTINIIVQRKNLDHDVKNICAWLLMETSSAICDIIKITLQESTTQ